jgi:hypothetical protein
MVSGKSAFGVAHRAVLDVAVLPDDDRRVVGADDGTEPHARAWPEPDVGNEVG